MGYPFLVMAERIPPSYRCVLEKTFSTVLSKDPNSLHALGLL